MNNINLNFYKIFYIVAKSKSISDASNKLFISQPAISKDIKLLEYSLKTKLIYRGKHGISLTKDGQELAKYLEESFGIINTAEQIIKQRNDLSYGIVALGCPSHISSLFLMERIDKFKKNYPNIIIKLISGSGEQLIDMLMQHKIDFVIDTSMHKENGNNLEIHFIDEFETAFISYEKKKIIKKEDFEKEDWILPFDYTGTRKRLMSALEENEIYIDSSLEIDVTDLIIDAVKRKMGIGYIIKESVKRELKEKELFEVKVNFELPKVKIFLINIKGQLTNADKIFINEYL